MSVIVLKPSHASATYNEAALVFAKMYEAVTGDSISITDKDDGKSDLVVIGSDAVNDYVMKEVLELRIDSLGIRYGTDDYCIRSHSDGDRKVIILAGGRGRSTLYAIYFYFEKYLGCHYFWDGDVIPQNDGIPMCDIDVVESPRFEYRGLRYFAHRGLKRFQAEHWSYEDWKREIDWMVKKRLNFFMLRIGMDDVWQRAFPKDVPYPEKYLEITGVDAEGYNDRSDFWTLKYRGELREKILEYARRCDLMYPTDCGTMTHWYSRTPEAYLKNKKPVFAHQECKQYCASDTGRVWDFTDKESMNNYMHLTETLVNEYEKQDELFHTIGLGERWLYYDKKKNLASKLIAYRRISECIREKYPSSKLMLASWDFVGWWSGDEVKKLISELDPQRTIILDYTSDVSDPNESFINWGVVGKFPWIYGLFHAYESESEIRGAYERSDERLKIAADDEYCKGMILWPELSHSDPLILEYLSENAWSPLKRNIEEITADFCKNRYGSYSESMNECWQQLLPFIKLGDWGSYSHRQKGDEKYVEYCSSWYVHQDMWSKLTNFLHVEFTKRENLTDYHSLKLEKTLTLTDNIVSALNVLANGGCALENEFILRDSIDLTRTVIGRFMNYIIIKALASLGNKSRIHTLKEHYMRLMDIMSELLSLNDDFSIYQTKLCLEKTAPTNPNFEITLKRNIYNGYCSQGAYELTTYVFKPEGELAFDWLMTADGKTAPNFSEAMQKINKKFMDTPLEEMQPLARLNPQDVIHKAADAVRDLSVVINR